MEGAVALPADASSERSRQHPPPPQAEAGAGLGGSSDWKLKVLKTLSRQLWHKENEADVGTVLCFVCTESQMYTALPKRQNTVFADGTDSQSKSLSKQYLGGWWAEEMRAMHSTRGDVGKRGGERCCRTLLFSLKLC